MVEQGKTSPNSQTKVNADRNDLLASDGSFMRYALFVLTAILLTLGLFLMMSWMVKGGDLPEKQTPIVYQMVMMESDNNSTRRQRQLPEKQELIEPPNSAEMEITPPTPITPQATPLPQISLSNFDSALKMDVALTMPEINVPTPITAVSKVTPPKVSAVSPVEASSVNTPAVDTSAMQANQQATPLHRVQPKYPNRMLRRRVEGYVILAFTINEQGRPENIQVVEAHPNNAFAKPAQQALSRWKYKPRQLNGQAVKQPNQRVKIEFKIAK